MTKKVGRSQCSEESVQSLGAMARSERGEYR